MEQKKKRSRYTPRGSTNLEIILEDEDQINVFATWFICHEGMLALHFSPFSLTLSPWLRRFIRASSIFFGGKEHEKWFPENGDRKKKIRIFHSRKISRIGIYG